MSSGPKGRAAEATRAADLSNLRTGQQSREHNLGGHHVRFACEVAPRGDFAWSQSMLAAHKVFSRLLAWPVRRKVKYESSGQPTGSESPGPAKTVP